jgi:hypothetical protein
MSEDLGGAATPPHPKPLRKTGAAFYFLDALKIRW